MENLWITLWIITQFCGKPPGSTIHRGAATVEPNPFENGIPDPLCHCETNTRSPTYPQPVENLWTNQHVKPDQTNQQSAATNPTKPGRQSVVPNGDCCVHNLSPRSMIAHCNNLFPNGNSCAHNKSTVVNEHTGIQGATHPINGMVVYSTVLTGVWVFV